MEHSKVKIKVGQIEVEFEGSEEFIKNELVQMVDAISKMHIAKIIPTPPSQNPANSENSSNGGKGWGVTTYAANMKVQTGTDLIIATCAYLTFEMEKGTFSRKEVLEEMKGATSYFKANYSKNLSRYFDQLVKNGDLVITSTKLFALSANKKSALEQLLAN